MKKKIVLYLGIFLLIWNLISLHVVLADETASQYPTAAFTQNYSPVNATYPSKEIIISLSREQLTAYDGNTLFIETPVTTGGPETTTPVGTYHILAKYRNFVMHSPWSPSDWRWYPDSFINYGLLFQTGGYFIHDASWRDNFGYGSNAAMGTPGGSFTGTHGCVNLPLSAESELYEWTTVGTTVIIQQ